MSKVKVKNGEIFERREKKYLLTPESYEVLVERLTEYMEFDEYGLHTIHTIYYDTDDFDVIRHSVSKPKFKEKMRLRSYGNAANDSTVFLELKKKVAGITYKRRVEMTYREAVNFLNFDAAPQNDKQIFKEIKWYSKQQLLEPKVLISYDRLAMKSKVDQDFRITFDRNIRYSLENFDLQYVDTTKQVLLANEAMILMEVKILNAFPLAISKLFSELKIFEGKFTKYGNVYQWILRPQWERQKIDNIQSEKIQSIHQGEQIYAKQYPY